MVRLEEVSFNYGQGGPDVLNSVSLEVAAGESLCVMGRNGSGKSTLARLIAGLSKPSSGRVIVNGKPASEKPGADVGILFQNADNQMVATLVEKEIAFALENKRLSQAEMEEGITHTAGRFGIGHLRRRLTGELSGGEKQRVALASVMVCHPPVLLLDEPDSFLDLSGRKILQRELDSLHHDQADLVEIRITQNMQTARTYQRLLIIDQGRIVADGPPSEILADLELMKRSGLTLDAGDNNEIDWPVVLTSDAERQVDQIVVDRVKVEFPLVGTVLNELSMALARGETIGLVGKTGSGKSTLGLVMAGVLAPAAGGVAYFNGTGEKLNAADRRGKVVALFQQPERQFFLDSCQAEIKFGPANLGRELGEVEIAQLMLLVGLEPSVFASRDPFTLSIGEKRRLAIATLLAMNPSVIILDEPTAGLDPEGVGRFLAISGQLKGQGLGQLVISHDEEIVKRLVDRVWYLESADLLVDSSVDEFFGGERFTGILS